MVGTGCAHYRGNGFVWQEVCGVDAAEYRLQKLIIFSRDELKQHDMRAAGLDHPSLRYFIGDVRDPQRLQRALSGVSVVVHAVALKFSRIEFYWLTSVPGILPSI